MLPNKVRTPTLPSPQLPPPPPLPSPQPPPRPPPPPDFSRRSRLRRWPTPPPDFPALSDPCLRRTPAADHQWQWAAALGREDSYLRQRQQREDLSPAMQDQVRRERPYLKGWWNRCFFRIRSRKISVRPPVRLSFRSLLFQHLSILWAFFLNIMPTAKCLVLGLRTKKVSSP